MDPAAATTAYRVLAGATLAWVRVNRSVDRAQAIVQQATSGFLGAAFTTAELNDLGLRLYGAAPGVYSALRGLMEWETAWYDASLPSPPATILVTAAGSGREAAALVARGYTVDALEPEPGFAAVCASVPGLRDFVTADHNQLASAVLDGISDPAAVLGGRTYDGVIIGWGSFTHLLDQAGRIRLLQAAGCLTPTGPVLLSFFAKGTRALPPSRLRSLSRAAGLRLARLRHVEPGAEAGDGIVWHLGFVHSFAEEDIEALARSVGRHADYASSPYGHATLRT